MWRGIGFLKNALILVNWKIWAIGSWQTARSCKGDFICARKSNIKCSTTLMKKYISAVKNKGLRLGDSKFRLPHTVRRQPKQCSLCHVVSIVNIAIKCGLKDTQFPPISDHASFPRVYLFCLINGYAWEDAWIWISQLKESYSQIWPILSESPLILISTEFRSTWQYWKQAS